MSEKVYRHLARELEGDEIFNFIIEGLQRLSREGPSEKEYRAFKLTCSLVQRLLHRRFPDEIPCPIITKEEARRAKFGPLRVVE